MKKFLQILPIFVVILMLFSCSRNYTKTQTLGFVKKDNIKAYLARLEKGYAFHNMPVTEKSTLDEIREYINARKDILYGDDENTFLFDSALIELYSSNFLKAFRMLREYMEKTGDTARTFYHVGEVLDSQFKYSGDNPLGLAALATRKTFPLPLDNDQHITIIAFNDLYPYKQMAPYLTDEILDRKELIYDLREDIKITQDYKLTRESLEAMYKTHTLLEEDIQELIKDTPSLDTITIDYLIAFYIHPYHQDFKRAAEYADMRNHKEWQKPRPEHRITNLMRAYLGVDRYEEVLDLYMYHIDAFREPAISDKNVNLLVSAAYAGLGDLDKSLEYLEKDFAITEIYYPEIMRNITSIEDFPTKGDMLYTLYELVFVFEEFDAFEKAGWFSEMEEVIERNIARFKHLEIFNR